MAPNLDQIRDAVSYVPRNATWNTERFKVLAVLSELGDDGLDIAASWQGKDKDTMVQILNGIRGRHRLTLGSLYHVAKSYGYKPKYSGPSATFTPDITVTSRYLEPLPLSGKVLAVKSPKGTGKTEVLKNIEGNVLVIGHRRTLLRQMANRLGVVYYSDVERDELPNQTRLAITLDSLTKIASGRLPNNVGTVIIDEVSQVLRHLSGTTLRNSRHNVLVTLSALLSKAERIIILDADLRDIDRDFVATLAKTSNVISLLNDYKPSVSRAIHRHATKDSLLDDLGTAFQVSGPVFVACSTKVEADNVAAYLESLDGDKRVLKVTSETTRTDYVISALRNINEVLKTGEIGAIVASPSLSTGIDITVPMHIYLIGADGFEGLCAGDLSQAIARVRNPIETHTFVPEFHRRRTTDPTDLHNEAIALGSCLIDYLPDGTRTVAPLTWEPAYLDYWSKVTALHNASTNNLAASFYDLLTEEGCTIVDLEPPGYRVEEYTVAAETAKSLALSEVLNAPTLSPEDYDALVADVAEPSPEQRASLLATRIVELFGVVDSTSIQLYDGGRFEDRLTLFGDVFGEGLPDGEPDRADLNRGVLATDVTHRRSRTVLARQILNDYFPDGWDKPGNPSPTCSANLAANSTATSLLLGWGAKAPTIALRNLAKNLGLGIVPAGTHTVEGKVQRRYRLDGIEEMIEIAQRSEARNEAYLRDLAENYDF